jgi:ankyrin repeat protein
MLLKVMKRTKKILIPIIATALLIGCGKPKPAIDIWTASAKGDVAAIKQNLAAGTDINAKQSADGSTPLMVAALFGQTEAAQFLVQKGAKTDARNNEGATALHLAAFFCQPETAQLLVDRGADENAKNNRGETPLDTVSGPWTPDLQNVYVYIAGYLHITLDLEKIKRGRPEMAEMLRKAG